MTTTTNPDMFYSPNQEHRTTLHLIFAHYEHPAFGEDDHVWGEAMLRLAGLREHEEHDLDATIAVLEQIAKRLKDGKHGKRAINSKRFEVAQNGRVETSRNS